MGCSGCGNLDDDCGCGCSGKVKSRKTSSSDPCGANYTGDLVFDGTTFICEDGPTFTIETGTAFNNVLASIFTNICSIYGILDEEGDAITSAITYDGPDFVCINDDTFNFQTGNNLNDVIAEIASELCEAIGLIQDLEDQITVTWDEEHSVPAVTLNAPSTQSVETLTLPATGTFIIHFAVSLDTQDGAEWVSYLRNNNTATDYRTGNDTITSNQSGSSELQNASNFAVVTGTVGDIIQIVVGVINADVTVGLASMYAQQIA